MLFRSVLSGILHSVVNLLVKCLTNMHPLLPVFPVLLGTVESVAVKHNERFVMVGDALEVNATDVTSYGNSLEVGPLDHCLFPALELGRTYLWTKNTLNQYEPLADVTGLTTPIHTILSLCQRNRTCYTA